MSTSKIFMLRPSLRAAYRHALPRSMRPIGRRTYVTMQERVAATSDRPWQIAAIGVTVPGLMYLRGSKPLGTGTSVQQAGPAPAAPRAKSIVESVKAAEPLKTAEERIEQKAEAVTSAMSSSSESEASMAPSSSAESTSQKLVDTLESQAEKVTDKVKAAVQSINPTQK